MSQDHSFPAPAGTPTIVTPPAPGGAPVALLGAAAAGAAVSIALGAYGKLHEASGDSVATFGFDSALDMKVWLATVGFGLGVVQVLTAAGMWSRLPGVSATPRVSAAIHRWTGTAAFLLVLPVAYQCLWSLGYQTFTTRVAVHSALGCAFFGVFTTKMLALRIRSGLPAVALPVLGGVLFALLAGLWATSSLWFFTTVA